LAQPGCELQSPSMLHPVLPKHWPVAPLQSGRSAGQSFGERQREGGGQHELFLQT
jgi:hypothetical protein